jgi:hypothetical protein
MLRMSRWGMLLFCAFCAIAAGCAEQDRASEGFTVDTLETGLIIARNHGTAGMVPWAHLELVLRIGSVDGEGPASFGRVADTALGLDGLIYVLDGMAAEVRVFDQSGGSVRVFGGPGGGPGELNGPYALAFDAAGDLWVAEERGNRYSVFRGGETFSHSVRRPIRYTLTGGELRVSADGRIHERGSLQPGTGAVHIAAGADSTRVDTTRLPAFERHMLWRTAGGERAGRPIPFAPTQTAAIGPGGELWFAHGAQPRFFRLNSSADTAMIIEYDATPVPLTPADLAVLDARVQEAAQEGFTAESTPLPRHYPLSSSLTVAEDGRLWVRRSLPGPDGAQQGYDVFDRDGRYLGSVIAGVADWPAPTITGEYVLGVTLDEFDVPYVALYRVVRRSGG